MLDGLCSPVILYVAFSIAHVVSDLSLGMTGQAVTRSAIAVLIAFVLQLMCERGMSIVSWIIVFIPFVSMGLLTALAVAAFNLGDERGPIVPNKRKPHFHHPHGRGGKEWEEKEALDEKTCERNNEGMIEFNAQNTSLFDLKNAHHSNE